MLKSSNAARICSLFPAIVFVAVALVNQFVSEGAATQPWRVGSFGMFSYIKDGFLICSVETVSESGERLSQGCGNRAEHKFRSLKAYHLPTEIHLTALAREMAKGAKGKGEVSLEYWEYSFNKDELKLIPKRLASVTVPIVKFSGVHP